MSCKVVQMKKEEENSWECCKVICWKLSLLIHMSRLWWTLQNSNKLTDTRCCGESFLGSGVKRLVAAPPPAAFTGYHAHAQHPKELRTYRKKSAQNIFFFKLRFRCYCTVAKIKWGLQKMFARKWHNWDMCHGSVNWGGKKMHEINYSRLYSGLLQMWKKIWHLWDFCQSECRIKKISLDMPH